MAFLRLKIAVSINGTAALFATANGGLCAFIAAMQKASRLIAKGDRSQCGYSSRFIPKNWQHTKQAN